MSQGTTHGHWEQSQVKQVMKQKQEFSAWKKVKRGWSQWQQLQSLLWQPAVGSAESGTAPHQVLGTGTIPTSHSHQCCLVLLGDHPSPGVCSADVWEFSLRKQVKDTAASQHTSPAAGRTCFHSHPTRSVGSQLGYTCSHVQTRALPWTLQSRWIK